MEGGEESVYVVIYILGCDVFAVVTVKSIVAWVVIL
jgi:hypothetical protein